MALLLMLTAVTLAGAQVSHEDPQKVLPTTLKASSDQISALLGHSLIYLDNASINVNALNYTQAGRSYYQFNQSCTELENIIWQLNGSNPDYDAIGASLNYTNAGLGDLLNNADNYNQTRQLYNASVAINDIANVSVYKVLVSDRYSRIIGSYENISSNASALTTQLGDMGVDTRPLQDAVNNLNEYIDWLNADYGSLGIGSNGSILYCGTNQTVASIGSDVRLSTYFVDSQGQPIDNAHVNFYLNNQLLGSNTTNNKGRTYVDYIVPASIEQDTLRAQAEYVPADGATPGVYSNPVLLQVGDLYTSISMALDKDEASYGDTVAVSGRLSPLYGVYAGGRTIHILFGDMPAGTTVTDVNGSYEYDFHIAPDTLAGTFMLNAVFQPAPGDILLNSFSQETSLNVTAQNASITLNAPPAVNLGDTAAFNGTLLSASDRPIQGVNILLYIDDTLWCNGTTDDNGVYVIPSIIPNNATVGYHTVYTAFAPGSGVSLYGVASGPFKIYFNDSGKRIDVEGVPLVLFADDSLNMTGTLLTGSGAPVTNRALDVRISGINATAAVTDGAGYFNTSSAFIGGELPALSPVTISDDASSSVLYERQVLLIPFDKWKVLGALVILGALISGVFAVTRMPRDRGQPAGRARVFEPETAAGQSHRPDFEIDREIPQIKAAMDKNDARSSLIQIYAATRKMVALAGVEVTDAMTEDGFYDKTAAAFPRVAPPLRYIVSSYRSSIDTHRTFSATELEMALKCLIYINRELRASQGA